jgi:hypothetical protein
MMKTIASKPPVRRFCSAAKGQGKGNLQDDCHKTFNLAA